MSTRRMIARVTVCPFPFALDVGPALAFAFPLDRFRFMMTSILSSFHHFILSSSPDSQKTTCRHRYTKMWTNTMVVSTARMYSREIVMNSTEQPLVSPRQLARYLGVTKTLIGIWVTRRLLWPDVDVQQRRFGFDLRVIEALLLRIAREELAGELDEPKAELIRVARRFVRNRRLARS
jgi:hypothetical protein